MTNLELARRLVDANLHVQFDAVLIDAVVAGGKLHGRIFLDQACRYADDTIVTTSSIRSTEEGGRVVITGRRRYLVQMAAETEEARREASIESADYDADLDPEGDRVDPVSLFADHSESLDALAAEGVPQIGRHMATLNLFREGDGSFAVTIADARGLAQEVDVQLPGETFHDRTIAALRSALGLVWQPIEFAPKDGTKVDLYFEEEGRVTDCYFSTTGILAWARDEWHGARHSRHVVKRVFGAKPTHFAPIASPVIA